MILFNDNKSLITSLTIPGKKKITVIGAIVWDCIHFCRAFHIDPSHLSVLLL